MNALMLALPQIAAAVVSKKRRSSVIDVLTLELAQTAAAQLFWAASDLREARHENLVPLQAYYRGRVDGGRAQATRTLRTLRTGNIRWHNPADPNDPSTIIGVCRRQNRGLHNIPIIKAA